MYRLQPTHRSGLGRNRPTNVILGLASPRTCSEGPEDPSGSILLGVACDDLPSCKTLRAPSLSMAPAWRIADQKGLVIA